MLEIACFTPSSAIFASASGADRIELCASYASGGTTPSMSSLLTIRANVPSTLPINIMIRPRGGDFLYSTKEFEAMRHDIALFAPLASGFVFGILDKAGRVDVARNSELVDIAAPLPCTFHRAVDEVVGGVEGAVESVIACGFESILTSGGGKSAEEGMQRVRMLQEKFGSRVSLIVGGGVRSGNVERIRSGAGVRWVHSAAITGDGEEVDGEEVRKIKEALGVGTKEENGDQEMDG